MQLKATTEPALPPDLSSLLKQTLLLINPITQMDSIFTIFFGASEPTPVETAAIEEVEFTNEDDGSGNTSCVIA
ncbi:hypothetical protein DL93DRAFT_2172033 [Clavulina sp. PMI_390]|nr:hypothetical protein DL93DRAFT_2172033 [Clavulina sp. PMI_390]